MKPNRKKSSHVIRFSGAVTAVMVVAGLAVAHPALAAERTAVAAAGNCQALRIFVKTLDNKKVPLTPDEVCQFSNGDVSVTNTSSYAVLLVRTNQGDVLSDNSVAPQGFTLPQPIFPTLTKGIAGLTSRLLVTSKNDTIETADGAKSRIPPGWTLTIQFGASDKRPLGKRVSVAFDEWSTVKYQATIQPLGLAGGKVFPKAFKVSSVLSCANSLAKKYASIAAGYSWIGGLSNLNQDIEHHSYSFLPTLWSCGLAVNAIRTFDKESALHDLIVKVKEAYNNLNKWIGSQKPDPEVTAAE